MSLTFLRIHIKPSIYFFLDLFYPPLPLPLPYRISTRTRIRRRHRRLLFPVYNSTANTNGSLLRGGVALLRGRAFSPPRNERVSGAGWKERVVSTRDSANREPASRWINTPSSNCGVTIEGARKKPFPARSPSSPSP